MEQFVYSFNEGTKDMSSILGMKGANLAEMTKLGLPVPFGFTITTGVCKKFYEDGKSIPGEVADTIFNKLEELEQVVGKKFGDMENPLLVSVRSGAEISMSGTLETILDLGLNDQTVLGLAKVSNNPVFAYDCYGRFIQTYGSVVLGIKNKKFQKIIAKKKSQAKKEQYVDLNQDELREIVMEFKDLILEETGQEFPQDVNLQLIKAIEAIFISWNNTTAKLYRKINRLDGIEGTAVNVQAMVYGNMGQDSCCGAVFTRNPINGEKAPFGDFLINAQGNDYSTGLRNPQPIAQLSEEFPNLYENFLKIAQVLETHYKDMQDMEFVIEKNKLYVLRTRSGKRTAQAAVKIAVDMATEGLIDKKTAVMRLTPQQIDQLVHPAFNQEQLEKANKVAQGMAACPGAACGQIYFTSADVVSAASRGEKTLLVKVDASQDDLSGMVASEGVLTARGARTSYASVVARGIGKCYVAGCTKIEINEEEKELLIGDKKFKEGDFFSIDGSDGKVYEGKIGTVIPDLSGDFATLTSWADDMRTLKVRANIDNARDAKLALDFGAQGVGLCRTEHMLYSDGRLGTFRRMILADSPRERSEALRELLPSHKKDFKGIFEVMEELPVTIRLLDPPLHDFLPTTEEEIRELSAQIHISADKLIKKFDAMKEFNPILGHRGCRLSITYPEIAQMQAEAIITAAIEVRREFGYDIEPEIMIPLVGSQKEVAFIKNVVTKKINEIMEQENESFRYLVGTMIETPRAALTADEIAREVDFFSFGTNDLTQLTYGISRDDSEDLLREYRKNDIFQDDPFQVLDRTGVGKLIAMGTKLGMESKPNIKLGVCGEQGADPKSIEFFYKQGIQYVSCSPYRIPIARLAAAQAAINNNNEK